MRSEVFREEIFGLSPLGLEGVKQNGLVVGHAVNGVGQREAVKKFEAGNTFKCKDRRWKSAGLLLLPASFSNYTVLLAPCST